MSAKRSLYDKYTRAFDNIKGVKLIKEPLNCKSNYWLQTLILEDNIKIYRNHILEETHKKGYFTRPVWNLMHQLEPFKNCPKMDLTTAEDLSKKLINIPSSPNLIDSKK